MHLADLTNIQLLLATAILVAVAYLVAKAIDRLS